MGIFSIKSIPDYSQKNEANCRLGYPYLIIIPVAILPVLGPSRRAEKNRS